MSNVFTEEEREAWFDVYAKRESASRQEKITFSPRDVVELKDKGFHPEEWGHTIDDGMVVK